MTFQDIFKSNFLENITNVSIFDMVIALTLSFGIGIFIFYVYKKTFKGVMYSSSFGVTLIWGDVMSKHKFTTAVCAVIVAVMLAITVLFLISPSLGLEIAHSEPVYVEKLFNTNKVHTIDIVVKESDWDDMIANAMEEEYIQGSVIIDGESVKGVGIRPKGNSSLSMIASSDSDRYSFKIEFDHYEKGKSYFGLDKLALNNIAQDNTYMKDYITYQMMNEMEADAPLSSFIWVTVNGKDWGLYLAVEAVEESLAQRVYGNNFGEIYKPDSMDMGDMQRNNGDNRDRKGFFGQDGQIRNFGGGFGGGATSLIYTDDNVDSYSAIFDNAAFDTTEGDKKRLIQSLKQLNEGENIEQIVEVDEVIRYFVVHNFVLNSDSYTGSMVHNYYLAENNGKLSMIAWDYNLAFGGMDGFGMGRRSNNTNPVDTENSESIGSGATLVNYPIDSPMLSGSIDDKPMIAWIFNNEEYLSQYHQVFTEYMEYFNSGTFTEMYDNTIALISPYVEKDPSAFCTYEEFQKGSSSLREFCLLRAKSINGQLEGTIASTSEGQTESKNTGFVDASTIDIESMGSNSMGFGGARGGRFQELGGENNSFIPKGQVDIPVGANNPKQNVGGRQQEGNNRNSQETNGQEIGNIRGQFPNMGMGSNSESGISEFPILDGILLLSCVIILIGGILFAKKK